MNHIHTDANLTLTRRLRRLRRSEAMRAMVRETRLSPDMFVLPLFVCEGEGVRREVPSMPGVCNLSVDEAVKEAQAANADGVRSVLLFGLPEHKDDIGSSAYDPEAPVQCAVRAIKQQAPDLLVMTDVCLCEYTSHGHCGLLTPGGAVDNDSSVDLIARTAVSQARAGADVVAPSDMMDGRIGAVRAALDEEGLADTPIVAYSAKFASAFYGPFREAAGSTPQFGDRQSYQMPVANGDEGMKEIQLDLDEGADIVMVKPAGPCLDLIRRAKDRFGAPLGAYQVSGEYAMIKAAAERGMLDENRAMWESVTGIRRAGADIILTYFAPDLAEQM